MSICLSIFIVLLSPHFFISIHFMQSIHRRLIFVFLLIFSLSYSILFVTLVCCRPVSSSSQVHDGALNRIKGTDFMEFKDHRSETPPQVRCYTEHSLIFHSNRMAHTSLLYICGQSQLLTFTTRHQFVMRLPFCFCFCFFDSLPPSNLFSPHPH